MAIDSLTGSFSLTISWTAQDTLTGADYNPITNAGNIRKSYNYGTANGNNTASGADQLVSYLISISGGGNTTVDLTSLTNILQQDASFGRLKGYGVRLLSTTDDSTNGTNCTSVTVGNAASNQQNLNLGTNCTMTVYNGGCQSYFGPLAAGFSTVDSTHKDLLIVNDDSTNTAKVQLTLVGGST